MRCLSLAKILKKYGWKIVLASIKETAEIVPFVNNIFDELYFLSGENRSEVKFLKEQLPDGCKLLIVDNYNLDKSFESELVSWAEKILVIDDLADRKHYCDFLVDVTPDRSIEDYRDKLSDQTLLLTGPKYALLEDRFFSERTFSLNRRSLHITKVRVLISVGAVDPSNLLLKILSAVRTLNDQCEFYIVLGTQFTNKDKVNHFCKKNNISAKIYTSTNEMPLLMSNADISIGASGHSAFERCCLGLPSVVITTAKNQELVANSLKDNVAAIVLGSHESVSEDEILSNTKKLIADHDLRYSLSRNAQKLCDGKGVLRTYLAITDPFFTQDGGSISLRLVESEDQDLIFKWQSHPDTRRYAHDQSEITLEKHKKWMHKNLSDSEKIFLMIIYNEEPAGAIRLDKVSEGDVMDISIYISPDMYRKGIANASVSLTLDIFNTVTFGAKVFPENIASNRLFRKLGFKKVQNNYYMFMPESNIID